MSSQAESVSVTVVESGGDKDKTTFVGMGLSSDSSTNITSGGNNVSFVNITYTIQPNPLLARLKEIPAKKILINVR